MVNKIERFMMQAKKTCLETDVSAKQRQKARPKTQTLDFLVRKKQL